MSFIFIALAITGIGIMCFGIYMLVGASRMVGAAGTVKASTCGDYMPEGRSRRSLCSVQVEFADAQGSNRTGTLNNYHYKPGRQIDIAYTGNKKTLSRGTIGAWIQAMIVLILGLVVLVCAWLVHSHQGLKTT